MKQAILLLFLGTMFIAACATAGSNQPFFENTDASLQILGDGTALLRSGLLPGTTISGSFEKLTDTEYRFSINQILMQANWPRGWTRVGYEASGEIRFISENNRYRIEIADVPQLWEIEEGSIRYNDTYYKGEQGMRLGRQRVDRIRETVHFLQTEKGFPMLCGHIKKENDHGPGFRRLQGAFLFPEFYDRKNSRVTFFQRGVVWDTAYTAAHFPEHLAELRDSGSLWRDFEEAPQLFLSLYNLESFFSDYINNTP